MRRRATPQAFTRAATANRRPSSSVTCARDAAATIGATIAPGGGQTARRARRSVASRAYSTSPEAVPRGRLWSFKGSDPAITNRARRDPRPGSGAVGRDHSAHSNQQVRDALELIRATAEETHCAALLVSHLLTKAPQGTDALARLADSHAFAGLPRSVLYLTPHPDDEAGERGSRKLLIAAKGNLVRPGNHALEVTVENAVAGLDDDDDRRPVKRAAW